MFGSQWLVAPVYTYQAASRSVYLPKLTSEEWIYFYGEKSYGAGGATVSVPTTNITEFPLFFRRPVTPPPAPTVHAATTYYSASRNDTVLCLGDSCTNANAPGQPGNYVTLRNEGIALLTDDGTGHVTLNGTAYPLTRLSLYYSSKFSDNFVSIDTTPPDSSYTSTEFANGFVFAAAPPGALPLQLWFKQFSATNQDYATVASADGVAWVQARGYTLVKATGAGWVLPA